MAKVEKVKRTKGAPEQQLLRLFELFQQWARRQSGGFSLVLTADGKGGVFINAFGDQMKILPKFYERKSWEPFISWHSVSEGVQKLQEALK